MPNVAALYRYPVKGFAPESCESLTLTPDGRVAGDRVLGFRFADTPEPDDAWSTKHGMLALVNTPGLARLRPALDTTNLRLRFDLDGDVLADEALDGEGRRKLANAVADFVLGLEESALTGRPDHLPLRLIGDGLTSRYQDRPPGYVTLHGRGSIEALDRVLEAQLSEVRFRSNVAIEGLEPFEEQEWMGRTLRIGSVSYRVELPIKRCLATHANPETGERDQPILTTLTRRLGQDEPTLAVALVPLGVGEIRLGDELVLEN